MEQQTFELVLASHSPLETLEIARRLGESLEGGEVIALVGDLGSGKTTFTKGLCLGLGVVDSRRVSSPTYVLEHIYEGRVRVHHHDAYRLQGPEELINLGFRENLGSDSVIVVEWADRVADALPAEGLRIDLSVGDRAGPALDGMGPNLQREIRFFGPGPIWARRLREISAGKGKVSDAPDR